MGHCGSNICATSFTLITAGYFNVHRNQMTGSIPPNMNMRRMFYMDLGRNQFSGTLPTELGTEYVRLRNLFLDHNQFSGTVPESYINAGDGYIDVLTLNNNKFTGAFPGNHKVFNRMCKFRWSRISLLSSTWDVAFHLTPSATLTTVELRIEHNNISSMNRTTCNLGVFSGGDLVEFKSDCLVCRCGVNHMCKTCVPNFWNHPQPQHPQQITRGDMTANQHTNKKGQCEIRLPQFISTQRIHF